MVWDGWKTSNIWDHSDMHGSASMRTPVSSAMTSASDEEWEMADCFLHSHESGTKVCDPSRHRMPPVVDLLSRNESAQLEPDHSIRCKFSG